MLELLMNLCSPIQLGQTLDCSRRRGLNPHLVYAHIGMHVHQTPPCQTWLYITTPRDLSVPKLKGGEHHTDPVCIASATDSAASSTNGKSTASMNRIAYGIQKFRRLI